MNNPSKNTRYINHLKLLGILFIILINCLLILGLLLNPYSLYFDSPECSAMPFETRHKYAVIVSITHIVLLLGLTIIMIIKYWKTKRFFIFTPLFSLLTVFIILFAQSYYPDSESEYTKEGYQFLEQQWYLNGDSTYKRFKSKQPINEYSDTRTIVWVRDSVSY